MKTKTKKLFKDRIDNRDTDFTIDQYSIFNLDREYEYEIDYLTSVDSDDLRESYGLPEFDDVKYLIDDYLDFSFDPEGGYHRALAETSLDLIKEVDGDELGLIVSAEVDRVDSPRFYNYTTDSYVFDIEVDLDVLSRWISDNTARLDQYLKNNPNLNFLNPWNYDGSHTMYASKSWVDDLYGIWILVYLEHLYESLDNDNWGYISEMFERTSEAAFNAVQWEIREDKKAECEQRIEQRIKETANKKEFLRTQLTIEGV